MRQHFANSKVSANSMATPDLLTYILGEPSHILAPSISAWIEASPRFKTFLEAQRDKVRKKVRVTPDVETLGDLQSELEIAYLFLRDPRFAVEYEKYVADKQRGPDFSVTFRTRLVFNVEVKRLRALASDRTATEESRLHKIINAVCGKLNQMPPSIVNLLFLKSEGEKYTPIDLAQAMRLLEYEAGRPDGTLLLRQGFANERTFSRQYGRLSGILVRAGSDIPTPAATMLWHNARAR